MRVIMQGLTDAEFEWLFGTEAQCLAAWVKVRQEAGIPCPHCENPKSYVYQPVDEVGLPAKGPA